MPSYTLREVLAIRDHYPLARFETIEVTVFSDPEPKFLLFPDPNVLGWTPPEPEPAPAPAADLPERAIIIREEE